MAIRHAKPTEIISLKPFGNEIAGTKTYTIFKTDAMEAIRLVMPAGKQIAEHKAPGEITVQCLEGQVKFTARGATQTLDQHQMLYLETAEPHAVEAVKDSSVLVTIVFRKPTEAMSGK